MQVNLEGYETIVIFGVESMVSYFKMLYISTKTLYIAAPSKSNVCILFPIDS